MTGILMASVGNSYGSAPVNTVAPVVSGTATVGQTLSTTNGTWLGAPAPTFTYQWQRTGVDIGGATSSTYVLVAADYANTIRCVVRATNSVAPAGVTANSNSTASVAGTAPVNTVAPAVTGTAQVRQTLTTTNGTWTGTPTPTFTYQWQRVTTNISGATSSTYVLVAADVGNTIRCVVTATNVISAVSANSNSTAAVAANVPAAPTIGTAATASSTSATVTYTAPADNGGATITLYTATSSPGGLTGTLATAGSGTITVSGLTTNTAYTFTVKATNSVGQSAASAASNSITPVLLGFIAGLSQPCYGPVPSGTFIDSSGSVYTGYFYGSAGIIVKYSSSGSLVFQTEGYANTSGGLMYLDSSDNYYYVGKFTTNEPQVSKFNSSNTFQWSRRWTEAGFSQTSTTYGGNMATDSSGNLYTFLTEYVNFCCGQDVYMAFRKLNSSGVLQALTNNAVNAYSTTGAMPIGIVPTASNILLAFNANGPLGTAQNSFLYLNSTGVVVSQTAYARLTNNSFEMFGFAYDYTNNVGYAVGRTNSLATVMKVNSTGVVVWSYTISSGQYGYGVDVDSSGNVYVVSTNSGSLNTVKINSSGTLQWSRNLTNSAATITAGDMLHRALAVRGTSFVISSGRNTATRTPFVFKAPTDGSGTGSYSQGGQTWTYATATTTLTAFTAQNNANFSTFTASASGSTTQTLSLSSTTMTSSTTTF